MSTIKQQFAHRLLDVKAIKLQPNDPFTWASGWKSPFYCDNRKTLSYPALRTFVKTELVHTILSCFPEAQAVAGVATGAIAQGALVAEELALPFCYVRSKAKDHGMQNLIEGQLPSRSAQCPPAQPTTNTAATPADSSSTKTHTPSRPPCKAR